MSVLIGSSGEDEDAPGQGGGERILAGCFWDATADASEFSLLIGAGFQCSIKLIKYSRFNSSHDMWKMLEFAFRCNQYCSEEMTGDDK